MTLAILGILAAMAAAGVAIPGISSALGKKAGQSASSSNNSSKLKNFFGSIGDWFKGIFSKKKGSELTAPIDGVGVSSLSSDYSDLSTPIGGDPVVSSVVDPSQTSAQNSVTTTPDAGSIAAHIEDTQNGGSAFNLDSIKDLFSNLGLGFLFNNSSDSDWKSYEDIVNDERQYGQGMINDARKWWQEMADTQYQRLTKDLEAAGLNPWLALQSGGLSPASVPNIDTGSALGSVSTSLSQSLSNSNSNSTSAILVAVIMLLARYFAK